MTSLQQLVHYITSKTTKKQRKNVKMTPLQRLVYYITIANFFVNTCNFIGLKPVRYPVPPNQVVTTQSR
jgi:hypothetical protein